MHLAVGKDWVALKGSTQGKRMPDQQMRAPNSIPAITLQHSRRLGIRHAPPRTRAGSLSTEDHNPVVEQGLLMQLTAVIG